jgi:hypothetical protein
MVQHAVKADTWTASVVVVTLVFLEVAGYPLFDRVNGNSWLVSLGVVVALVGSFLYGYPLTGLILAILLMRYHHLLKFPSIDAARMGAYLAAARSDPRFSSSEVDIEMANGTLQQFPPRMLAPPNPKGPLLLYPPTSEQLRAISGTS